MYQLSEWNLMVSNEQFTVSCISYSPTVSVSVSVVGINSVIIEPMMNVLYSSWTISPSLPDDLILNRNDDTISGSLTVELILTVFIVWAIENDLEMVLKRHYGLFQLILQHQCLLLKLVLISIHPFNPISLMSVFKSDDIIIHLVVAIQSFLVHFLKESV